MSLFSTLQTWYKYGIFILCCFIILVIFLCYYMYRIFDSIHCVSQQLAVMSADTTRQLTVIPDTFISVPLINP
uniref:Uncharacterized protein n=1 Tax=viral metagenome TaxID=1070528 RepID=A0A6C0CR68_9ZZZZ